MALADLRRTRRVQQRGDRGTTTRCPGPTKELFGTTEPFSDTTMGHSGMTEPFSGMTVGHSGMTEPLAVVAKDIRT